MTSAHVANIDGTTHDGVVSEREIQNPFDDSRVTNSPEIFMDENRGEPDLSFSGEGHVKRH